MILSKKIAILDVYGVERRVEQKSISSNKTAILTYKCPMAPYDFEAFFSALATSCRNFSA
jgi:hypothetical protein